MFIWGQPGCFQSSKSHMIETFLWIFFYYWKEKEKRRRGNILPMLAPSVSVPQIPGKHVKGISSIASDLAA